MFLILITVLAVTVIYWKVVKIYSYWTDKDVKQRKLIYFFGDTAGVIFHTKTFWDAMLNMYKTFPKERYVGVYQALSPALMLRDPDLIKEVAVKDFDHFVDHMAFVPEGADELWNRNLIALKGNRWRDMRSTMSPSFTSSKMKTIFNLVSECALEFNKYFLETSDGITTVELKDIFTRYTNDVIATSAFGIKCNSLREPKNEFYVTAKQAMTFDGCWKIMKFFTFIAVPKLCKFAGMTLFGAEVNAFFKRIVKETITQREEKGIVRPDMLHLLMEAQKGRLKQDDNPDLVDAGFAVVEESVISTNNKILKEEITDTDITAQALIFFFGGFESVSTVMCFMGYELVQNPQVQEKLQTEIDETVKECKGILTYEALLKMKYMDMVISETLRKWPPTIVTDRECTKPYTIQPTTPSEKPLRLVKGDVVWIPINALHWDPQYFPEPEKFLPERFSDENKDNIKPYTYLPFGAGPRNCIGSRFALLDIKAIYFYLLSKFDLVRVEKTQTPVKLSKRSINVTAENGIYVGLRPRSGLN